MPEPNADTTPKSSAPPAYFLSLTVENFRCFKQSVTLDLSDGDGKPSMWNVILGENGVGKTSSLRVIAALSPTLFRDRLKNTVEYDSLFRLMFYRDYNEFAENVESSHFSALLNVCDLSGQIRSTINNERLIFGLTSDGVAIQSLKFNEVDYPLVETPIFCFGASRKPNYSTNQSSLDPPFGRGYEMLFTEDAELINAEEWLVQADYATKTATGTALDRAKQRLEQVVDLVCGVLPSGGVIDIRFGLNENTAVMTPRVEAKTPFGWVRLRDLSLGYQAALTWMVDLAARMLERYPDSPKPLAEPAIVLVDEIDLHLHPKWQRELITKLRTTFPRTQFIVTAHSPLIVQAAPNANIALLKRVGDHVEIENDVDHIRNWRADQILTSDLFGLESARPPHLDKAFRDREAILTKPSLTEADWKRLDEINREIGETPEGETTGDMEAQNLVRRAAQLLRGK